MTDTPDRKPRRRPGEPDVEEARLRQQAIGVKLRQLFNDVVNEPVPDEFLEILRRADEKSAPPSAVGAASGSPTGDCD
jgi:urease accessory protein UreF